MRIRTVVLGLLAAAAVGASCQGQPSGTPAPASRHPLSPGSIARVHWLGKRGIAARSDAAGLMKLWSLPQSTRLETQTLDKLAAAFAQWPATNQAPTAYSRQITGLIRPLVEDLLYRESVLEVREAGPQAHALALAIRLDPQRASLWEANLNNALNAVPGAHAESARNGIRSWQLPAAAGAPGVAARLALMRAGEWTLVGLGPDPKPLLNEFASQIQRQDNEFRASAANAWLEAGFDPRRLAPALGLKLPIPDDLAQISFSTAGDGATVIEHAQLDFSKPLEIKLEPWKIPVHLIAGQITSFTAVRGCGPWLASFKAWSGLNAGPPPNQAFFWSLRGLQMLSFCAAPSPDAAGQVSRISDAVLKKLPTWFPNDPSIAFQRAKKYNGLEWRGFPGMWPFLKSTDVDGSSFLFAGFFASPRGLDASVPLPPQLVKELETRKDLVAYGWELSPQRVEAWTPIGQTLRLVAQKAQMPAESAGQTWLKAAGTNVWATVTELTRAGPSQLSFKRRGSLGLSGLELHLLADWLESPEFPHGFHTLLAPARQLSQAPVPAGSPRRPPGSPPRKPRGGGPPGGIPPANQP